MASQKVEELVKAHPDIQKVLLTKWERIFSLFFDRNHSMKVDWGDFYLVSRKVRDIYGAESKQYEYAKKTLAELWEGLCRLADKDHDQLITIHEWIAAMQKVTPSDDWLREYKAFMFHLLDVSKDGVLDMAEYSDGMALYGVEEKNAHAAFSRLIEKPGEKISPEKWSTLFDQLFFSKDEKAVGNNLFGVH